MPEFPFQTDEQEAIHRRLGRLVGPGAQAFYRDACRLMAQPDTLLTTAHLVAHLMRELDSALRQALRILTTDADVPLREDEKEQRRAEVLQILSRLGFTETDDVGREWLRLGGLAALAHRSQFDQPRSLEAEVAPLWRKFSRVLGPLLDRWEQHYARYFRIMDELLDSRQPSIRRLYEQVPPTLATQEYFFTQLDDPAWLPGLRRKHFFEHPPEPLPGPEPGHVSLPRWPQADYLKRMAERAPHDVAGIIAGVPRCANPRVFLDLADAVQALPMDLVIGLVPIVAEWIDWAPFGPLAEKIAAIATRLVDAGHATEGLVLFTSLLEPVQDQRAGDELISTRREPRPKFDVYSYDSVLRTSLPALQAQGLTGLRLLCHLVHRTLALMDQQSPEERAWEDYSWIWRRSLDAQREDIYSDGTSLLISALVSSADLLAASHPEDIGALVELLEAQRWTLFLRLVLRLMRSGAEALPFTQARLQDSVYFHDDSLAYEYRDLLRLRFHELTASAQAAVLSFIEAGPSVTPEGMDPEVYAERWLLERLAVLGDQLTGAWAERLSALEGKYGPAQPTTGITHRVSFGPTSPIAVAELRPRSVRAIVEYLGTWQPPREMLSPTMEGLSRVLADVVARAPSRFANQAGRFRGLDPTYVRGMLTGLWRALRAEQTFAWDRVLTLCRWATLQADEDRPYLMFEADRNWSWTRKAVADLLWQGLRDSPGAIPLTLRRQVWRLISRLSEDPDPQAEQAGGRAGDLALNSTRGVAMHGVMTYLSWTMRHSVAAPEAWTTLERHLQREHEQSPAIRGIYGERFAELLNLDPEWTRSHATDIFPQAPEEREFFRAAWSRFLARHEPHPVLLDILRGAYAYAVRMMTEDGADERENVRLGVHLTSYYVTGALSLDDPLLQEFYASAAPALRRDVMAELGAILYRLRQRTLPGDQRERLQSFFSMRLDLTERGLGDAPDLEPFGMWLASRLLDVVWGLAALARVLQVGVNVHGAGFVADFLCDLVEERPTEVLNCLTLWVRHGDITRVMWTHHNQIKAALSLATCSDDPVRRRQLEELVSRLAARGYPEFREVLPPVTG